MSEAELTTLNMIHAAAKAEFLQRGFKSASLRNIVKTAGVTTGAFYGYYSSKAALFEALVGKQYETLMASFVKAQRAFAALPAEKQPENMSEISGSCMREMLVYAYENLDAFKLILCCSDGTRFSAMIDEMAEIEIKATHDYMDVLEKLGTPSPAIDPRLEHILVTGMFNAYFELIIHEMPLEEAQEYLEALREFHTAGWQKLMRQ